MSFSFESKSGADVKRAYSIYGHNESRDGNPAGGYAHDSDSPERPDRFAIYWQDGPVNREAGEVRNGAFVEDVLQVCHERLKFYQDSPFACAENAEAMECVNRAIAALMCRREDRRAPWC